MEQQLNGFASTDVSCMKIYLGPERRNERRRKTKTEAHPQLLKNFGFEQRNKSNRRKANTSWLLTSH